jgi:hypothetical protein
VTAQLAAGQPVGFAGTQVLLGACLSLVILIMNVSLSVAKPWGMTRWGVRRNNRVREHRIGPAPVSTTS